MFARDYYWVAFGEFVELIWQQGFTLSPAKVRESFWVQVTAGMYESDGARAHLEAYLKELEASLESILGRNSLAYWLHFFRRVRPTAIGDDDSPTTIALTRSVLDAAIQKFARFELCNRIARSDHVSQESILRGYLVKANDTATLEVLAIHPQFVLTDFGPEEYREAMEVEKLAYEVWRTMAQLRTIGKGAPLVVSHDKEFVRDNRSADLEWLLEHLDNRQHGFAASSTATVFGNVLGTTNPRTIALPHCNAAGNTFDELREMYESIVGTPQVALSESASPNYVWLPFDLKAFYEAHKPFSDSLRELHGVSLESVVGLIGALVISLARKIARYPEYFLRMGQRAYEPIGEPSSLKTMLANHLPAAIRSLALPFSVNDVNIDAAFDYFALSEVGRGNIDVAYGGPHSIFLPAGESGVFIDYAHLIQRLYYLFLGVTLPNQNFKGDALEQLTHQGRSVLPTGALKGLDGSSRQIDAAFEIADGIAVCECRATARSIAVEKGDAKALAKRHEVLNKALSDIDEKAKWLATQRKGTNFDIGKYQFVLPLAVTPFAEFIPSRDPYFWIDSSTPRVLTPAELHDAIADKQFGISAVKSANALRLS